MVKSQGQWYALTFIPSKIFTEAETNYWTLTRQRKRSTTHLVMISIIEMMKLIDWLPLPGKLCMVLVSWIDDRGGEADTLYQGCLIGYFCSRAHMIDNYIREVIGDIGAKSKKEQLLGGFCNVLEQDQLYQSKWIKSY